MRSQILRDVVAGCAGVFAVIAIIGLPARPATSNVQTNDGSTIRACLLPAFSGPHTGPHTGSRTDTWQVCPVMMPLAPRLPAAPKPISVGPAKTP
jgi:hypothetical protein